MSKTSILIIGLSIVLISGIAIFLRQNPPLSKPPSAPVISGQSTQPKVETLITGLEIPWALAFLPDKNILVTERAGQVRLIKNGSLEKDPIAAIQVKQTGEGGLHGIAVDPNFPNPPFVYLYYTYSSGSNNSLNRVSRFSFKENILTDEQVIVDNIPGAINHDGGRVKFGPDGYLYITTGDAQNPSLSQNKDSLAGKILRVTTEGKFAPNNPFNTLIYSYGHRNPQGITWDNQGRLWETEHGQSAQDELNLIIAGKNYGWPDIRGDQTKQDMERPLLQSGSDTWAPGGAAFFKGSIFYAGLRGTALYQYVIDTKELKTHFKGEFGRIREVVLGPDNMLYITTSNKDGRGNPKADDDKIIRINPEDYGIL